MEKPQVYFDHSKHMVMCIVVAYVSYRFCSRSISKERIPPPFVFRYAPFATPT